MLTLACDLRAQGSPCTHPDIPLADDFHCIFPNQVRALPQPHCRLSGGSKLTGVGAGVVQPYEEKKKAPLSAEEKALRAPRKDRY